MQELPSNFEALRPLVLVILDGFGIHQANAFNAITQANTPFWDYAQKHFPHIALEASGKAVGLPDGQMGNSEVGHMHIGAGRTVYQDLTRIDAAIENNSIASIPVLLKTLSRLKQEGKTLHLIGLCSPGGVHSHIEHLLALLRMCQKTAFQNVALHAFLDGRDTPPKSALKSIARIEEVLTSTGAGRIASISGRYYAMDRDKRFERLEPVYTLLTTGESPYHFNTAEEAIDHFYVEGLSDEFIPACVIGTPAPIKDGDAVLFFNFRADRAKQLCKAFLDYDFQGFERKHIPALSAFLTMTQYDERFAATALFPPIALKDSLGEVLAAYGMSQLRIAETEKYAHVTYFFNGGKETAFEREDRLLIPSPKVATYDLQPEMSAFALCSALVEAIRDKTYDVIIANFANPDMVGHSGNLEATVKAIEAVDSCLQRIFNETERNGGLLVVTADHGNAECMHDEAHNQPHTAHTTQPVPFLIASHSWRFIAKHGSLADVAPSLLAILDIPKPEAMTGHCLITSNYG